MICLMVGSGVMDVFAAGYDKPVSVTIPYTHIYDADRNRTNDSFKYTITALDGAPSPAENADVYSFIVTGKPGGEAVSGEVNLSITFDKPGEYLYKVASAKKGSKNGFTYESRTYTVHVYVQNDAEGGLAAPIVTAVGDNGRKYQRLQLNPSHESENVPANRARPTTTPRGDGTVPAVVNTAGEPVDEEEAEPEEVPEAPTPLQNILPKPDPERHYWSLVNLIAAILTVLASAALVFRYFERIDTDDDEYIIRRKGNLRLAGLVPSIVSVVVFLLTEDLTQPMGWIDEWTPLMLGVLAIDILLAIIAHQKYSDDDRDAEGQPA